MSSPASSPGFHVGPDDVPDKYRLRRMVGSGGEAQLWQADLVVAGRNEPVAVKVLRPEHSDNFAQLSARWSEQAELLRFVRHPGVVGVREHFEGAPLHEPQATAVGGQRRLYLVMNWVEGRSLRDWAVLNDGPAATLDAIRHLDQIAEVLDLLHSGRATPGGRPLVHGDLSPGNVMIDEAGQAILVDFGLIRTTGHRTSHPMGTQGFAAPETWRSGEYSPAADRYSFGAVAFFALTGAAPVGSREQLRAGLTSNPLLTHRDPTNIEWLLSIFDDDPARRPPSALQWVQLLRNTATTTRPPHPTATGGARPTVAADTSGPGRAYAPTVTGPPPAPVPSTTQRGRTGLVAAVVAAAVVIAVLASIALPALLGGGGTGGAAAPGGTTPPVLATPTPTPTPVPDDAEASAPVPLPPPVTFDAAPSAEITIHRSTTDSGPIVVSSGYALDLDTEAANWDVSNVRTSKSDIGVRARALSSRNGSDFAPVDGPASYATCKKATGYEGDITIEEIEASQSYCVRTSEKRHAYITINNLESPFSIHAVVWDPPYAG